MAMGKVTKSFKVTLDIARSISNREFSVVEGDTGNTLSITLNDDGKAVDLTGCRVKNYDKARDTWRWAR